MFSFLMWFYKVKVEMEPTTTKMNLFLDKIISIPKSHRMKKVTQYLRRKVPLEKDMVKFFNFLFNIIQ